MPKNDMWSGGVAMEPLSNMDSAGSCESVISMNSGYSEDSMEHLSPEERACLMYLEETIEALEVQEDSGFSNDEPDPGLHVERTGQTNVNDSFSLKPDDLGGAEPPDPPLPVPLVPAVPGAPHNVLRVTTDVNGNPKIVPQRPQSGSASAMIPPPSDFMDRPRLRLSLDKGRDSPLYPGARGPGGAIDLEQLRQRAAGKRHSIGASLSPPTGSQSGAQVSPPGSPEPPSPSTSPGPAMTPTPPPPEAVGPLMTPPPPESPGPLLSPPLSESSGVFVMSRSDSPGSQTRSSPPESPDSLMRSPPPPDWAEPRSPPAVAPKPKKLPANIVLKSNKKSVSGPETSPGFSGLSGSERMMLDPQRVRFEALRKLGLLKGDETEPGGPALSPRLSPKTRGSWAAPPSPVSPATSSTPSSPYVHSPPPVALLQPPPVSPAASNTALAAPSNPYVHSPPPVTVLQPPPVFVLQPPPPVLATVPDFLPAPAAFRDPGEAQFSEPAKAETPPLIPITLTPPKYPGVKAATLERSGPGLTMGDYSSSVGAAGGLSPAQLRNTRPRPASLGNHKEFPAPRTEPVPRAEPDPRRSLPPPAALPAPRDSQKLPRSEGISVLICPRSENEEDRRAALKKLGLLRD